MARALVLEVDKEGNIKLQAQAANLPAGVTLKDTPTPTVSPQRRSATEPETWEAAVGVTIDQIAVTDRIDIGELPTVVVLAADQAIQFRWKKDPDAQPDVTDDPVPGTNYRVVIVAQRSDGSDWVGKARVTIHP